MTHTCPIMKRSLEKVWGSLEIQPVQKSREILASVSIGCLEVLRDFGIKGKETGVEG